MITIRPVSDLRNKFPEIEETILQSNSPVFLTKNGYGTMVLLSIEQYAELTDSIENKLDEADIFADTNATRLSQTEVFSNVRHKMIGK